MKLTALLLMVFVPTVALAQDGPVIGASVGMGGLPRPYAFACGDDQPAALGVTAQAGVRRGSFTFTGNFTHARKVAEPACPIYLPPPIADGTYTSPREYPATNGVSDGIEAFTVRAGYTAGGMITGSVGGGLEVSRRDPVLVASLIAHPPGRIRFFGGVECMLLRAPYRIVQRQYVSHVLVNTQTLEQGHAWRRALSLVVGFQQTLGRK